MDRDQIRDEQRERFQARPGAHRAGLLALWALVAAVAGFVAAPGLAGGTRLALAVVVGLTVAAAMAYRYRRTS